MSRNAASDAFRRFLKSILDRLEKNDSGSVRSKSEAWYQKEFHFPPMIVGVSAAILLFLTLLLSFDYTGRQATVMGFFIAICMTLFSIYLHREQTEVVHSDEAMSLLAVVFFVTLIWIMGICLASREYHWLTPYATPVAIAPLLTALLLNSRLAMVMAFAVSLVFGLVNGFSMPIAMVGALGGVTGAAAVSSARTAHHVAKAGLVIGIVQVFFALFVGVMMDWNRHYLTVVLISALVSGVVSAMFSLGVLPYLEGFFSRISNLRLVELAASNHPLLQRMSLEAPGTYHHSLVVASLAEDAANAIGANGLLARVGAAFHDVGKMVKAEYFIENQGPLGSNPHDQVSPSLSKIVITSHVKEGIALARLHKLDRQIIDFIPQHHGTSQIEYFYRKALKTQAANEGDDLPRDDVKEETYRYPGPKPQTKEAGIVMLADSCEATARTLEDPSHQRFKDVVTKIVNKKLNDGQLDETPLTFRDLHVIAERFAATLVSVHHARIAYPTDPIPGQKDTSEAPKVQ